MSRLVSKSELSLEKYLINLPDDLRMCFKFRMCNHKLPIGLGRHNNIEINLRKCNECGDKCYYLFIVITLKKKDLSSFRVRIIKSLVLINVYINVNSFKQEDYQIDKIC